MVPLFYFGGWLLLFINISTDFCIILEIIKRTIYTEVVFVQVYSDRKQGEFLMHA